MPYDDRSLSPRCREALDLIYQNGKATANDLLEAFPDIPSYSAARSVMRNLEAKGYVEHVEEDGHYVYKPTIPREEAAEAGLRRLMETFFGNSPVRMMQTVLKLGGESLHERSRQRLDALFRELGGSER